MGRVEQGAPETAPETALETEERVLVVAPHGRDAAVLLDLLAQTKIAGHACAGADALARALAEGTGAVMLTEEALEARAMEVLTEHLAAQPSWSELPLVLLTSDGAPPEGHAAVVALVRHTSATVLERPVSRLTLVTAVQTALRARRRQYEVRDLNADLERRVEARTAEVRALAGALTLAEQRERQRISQVLHDDLQQFLYGTQMHIELLQKDTAEAAPGTFARLGRVGELLEEALRTTRTLTTELSPPVLQEQGLGEALVWLANWMEEVHKLHVAVEVEEACPPLGEEMRLLLFGLVRELLFNVVKHAGTDRARVALAAEGGHCRIEVVDEGAGFDPGVARARRDPRGGFGLFSAWDRLGLLGGHLEIESAPGAGTQVTIMVPLAGA